MKKWNDRTSIRFDTKTKRRIVAYMKKNYMENFSETVRVAVNKFLDSEGIK